MEKRSLYVPSRIALRHVRSENDAGCVLGADAAKELGKLNFKFALVRPDLQTCPVEFL